MRALDLSSRDIAEWLLEPVVRTHGKSRLPPRLLESDSLSCAEQLLGIASDRARDPSHARSIDDEEDATRTCLEAVPRAVYICGQAEPRGALARNRFGLNNRGKVIAACVAIAADRSSPLLAAHMHAALRVIESDELADFTSWSCETVSLGGKRAAGAEVGRDEDDITVRLDGPTPELCSTTETDLQGDITTLVYRTGSASPRKPKRRRLPHDSPLQSTYAENPTEDDAAMQEADSVLASESHRHSTDITQQDKIVELDVEALRNLEQRSQRWISIMRELESEAIIPQEVIQLVLEGSLISGGIDFLVDAFFELPSDGSELDVRRRFQLCRAVLKQSSTNALQDIGWFDSSVELVRSAIWQCIVQSTRHQREWLQICADLSQLSPAAAIFGIVLPSLADVGNAGNGYTVAEDTDAVSTAILRVCQSLPSSELQRLVGMCCRASVEIIDRRKDRNELHVLQLWRTATQSILAVRVVKQHVTVLAKMCQSSGEHGLLGSLLSVMLEACRAFTFTADAGRNVTKSLAEEVAALVHRCMLKLKRPLLQQHATDLRQLLQHCIAAGAASNAANSSLRKLEKLR